MSTLDTDYFSIPKQTFQWAREALFDLEKDSKKFLNRENYNIDVEIDPDTFYETHLFRFRNPIPSNFARRATEALNNSRHAFDQIIYAGSASIRELPKKETNFPWSSSPTDLEHALIRKDKEIPQRFRDIIRKYRPYPTSDQYSGGNDVLRALAKLANSKHTIGLRICGNVTSVRGPNIFGADSDGTTKIYWPRWDSSKNEMKLCTVPKGAIVKYNIGVNFMLSFEEPPPLEDLSVGQSIENFIDFGEAILEEIERASS